MKRNVRIVVSLLLVALLSVSLFAAGQTDAGARAPARKVINVWSFTDEVPKMLERYKELNPSFDYEINTTIIATTDGAYQPALDQALAAGGENAPDLYCAESAFVLKYTQGDAAHFAAPYASLGIDVDAKLKEADIAQYTVDIGTNDEGQLVGLGYQATGGAFIYRRSIAKDVWGTDDPAVIKTKIGPGWDKFFEAAEALRKKGYGIISGDGDIWHAIEGSSEKGWLVGDKLYVDPEREAFLDIAKMMVDKDYHNDTRDWTDAWFADMKDAGSKKVFGYFGPAWLINYVMAGNSGG
ncbi:MAG: carbohydrate ABC transporter substrate-binding protein, partial [Spirochaetia bacterium]|nr:carbohydrate ABC transporter substrate-binding protein [Spirochaetia bacterium]